MRWRLNWYQRLRIISAESLAGLASGRCRRHFGRQGQLKPCATSVVGSGPQATTMGFYNRPADREAHAGSLRLCREESIENLVCAFGGQTHTSVADGDQQWSFLARLRLDCKVTSGVLHGLDSVAHQVHEYLLKLHAVCGNFWKIRG